MLSQERFHVHHSVGYADMMFATNATDSAKYEQYKCIAINYTLPACPTVIKTIKKISTNNLLCGSGLFQVRTSRNVSGDWDEPSWISSQIGFYRQTQLIMGEAILVKKLSTVEQ